MLMQLLPMLRKAHRVVRLCVFSAMAVLGEYTGNYWIDWAGADYFAFVSMTNAPVQLLPQPAVQARQCSPVRITQPSRNSGVTSHKNKFEPSEFRICMPSIWLKSQS